MTPNFIATNNGHKVEAFYIASSSGGVTGKISK